MRLRYSAFVFLALLATALPAAGQTAVDAGIGWTRHTLESTALGTERTYAVVLPPGYEQSKERYPVLVLLDASDAPQFVAAIANMQFLASRNEVPNLIIVGIPNGADRTRDMTVATRAAAEMKLFPTAGGADSFLSFIADEVLPQVRTTYRAANATFLAGHSFGGLFALYTSATRPGLFKGAIAMSPSLQWSNAEYVNTWADMIAKQATPLRLFVTSGGLEPPVDSNTQRFKARWDTLKHSGVTLEYRRYPDDTHGLTPLPSLIDGLRFMFEPLSSRAADGEMARLPRAADSAAIVRVVADMEQKYVKGAEALGISSSGLEGLINRMGYTALEWFENPKAAIAIFKRNLELYPESANVYDSLGDAYLAGGDKAAARAAFAKAVELAIRTNDRVLPESTRKLKLLDNE